MIKIGRIAVIFNFDDYYDARDSSENIAWLYDTDYELLNSDNIKQIIFGGARCKDHVVRSLLAGIPKEKMNWDKDEIESVRFLDVKNVDKIYILHDVYTVDIVKKVKEAIISKIKEIDKE